MSAGPSHGAHQGSPGYREQQHYYDEVRDPEFEIRRPHGCGRLYQFLIREKFRAGFAVLGLSLTGRSVLEVCSGSGMLAEVLARHGARVTGIDVSPEAVGRARERARRYGFRGDFHVADAEHLPFRNRSFDVVAVHDGLHHLDEPSRAVAEMGRVARDGVLILEPARAALTRVAIRLGWAEEVEEAGNLVRRLAVPEVRAWLSAMGFDQVAWRRTLMYYPHEPFAWFRWFDSAPGYGLVRAAYWGSNILLGRFGNKLALGATRSAS